MKKDSQVFHFRRMPWALIGAILLSLLFQQAVRGTPAFWKFCYLHRGEGLGEVLRMEAELDRLPASNQNSKVFLLGSSCVFFGLDVNALDKAFAMDHLNFYNLGLGNAAYPVNAFMEKSVWLKKNPAIVIYMLNPRNIYTNTLFFDSARSFDLSVLPYLVRYLGYREVLSNWKIFVGAIFEKFSLFYKYKDFFSSFIIGPWINNSAPETIAQTDLGWEHSEHRSQAPLVGPDKRVGKNRATGSRENGYTELNKALFSVFAKDLVARGIKLIVVNGPSHFLLKLNARARRRFVEKLSSTYSEFLQRQSREIGFAYVNAESLPDLDETCFSDAVHLNQKGRAMLTQFIENYLHNYLSLPVGYKGAD